MARKGECWQPAAAGGGDGLRFLMPACSSATLDHQLVGQAISGGPEYFSFQEGGLLCARTVPQQNANALLVRKWLPLARRSDLEKRPMRIVLRFLFVALCIFSASRQTTHSNPSRF